VKWTDEDPVTGGASRVDGDEAKDVVAFTFDDGPSEKTTAAVLDALKQYDVPATFFVVTKRLRGKVGAPRRELLAREIAEGHTIGSHTVSHPNLRSLGKASVVKEIDNSLKMLTKLTGQPIGMFRPPFGALSSHGAAQLKKRNLTDVRWELDSYDFRTPNPKKLRAKVAKMIANGGRGVILFHDTKQVTAKSIALILDDLEAMNCGRLAAGEEPVLPVSLHYFLEDRGTPRPVPPEVEARTQRYKAQLPTRCAARAQPTETKDSKPGETSPDAGSAKIDNHIEPH
jgi:peptidoglycan/xylan/chitin deacetylase (PgdA/CDA1 family)